MLDVFTNRTALDHHLVATGKGESRYQVQGREKVHAIPPVPCAQAFVNRQTKPYPDKDSNSLFKTNRSRGDAQTLHVEHIAQGLSHLNCEWHNGLLAHAMSFLCQNLTNTLIVLER